MKRTRRDRQRASALRHGFTMIELMVVITIIAILAALSLAVGQSVISKRKVQQCRDFMQLLDNMLVEYEVEYQGMPPYTGDETGRSLFAYVEPEGYDEGGEPRPEVAAFLAQVHGLAGADNQLKAIPPQFLMRRNELYADLIANGAKPVSGDLPPEAKENDDRISLRDPWGMEILYIHPGDEDAVEAYGKPANNRPYFMSCGPDSLYDTLDDNIYSYEAVKRPKGG